MTNCRDLLLSLLLTLLAALIGNPDARAQEPARMEMSDQFGKQHRLRDLRGNVVALVMADKEGAKASRSVGERLHVEFHPSAKGVAPKEAAMAPVRPLRGYPQRQGPDVKMIPVAVIGEVPAFIQPIVRREFRRVAPDTNVWLDLTDQIRNRIGLTPGVPNVLVFDVRGVLRFQAKEVTTQQQFDQLVATIDTLRLETTRTATRPAIQRASHIQPATPVTQPATPVTQPATPAVRPATPATRPDAGILRRLPPVTDP